MRKLGLWTMAVALSALAATPVVAAWKLASQGVATTVAKGTLTVTPGEDWNRASWRPIKKSEIWTLDGTGLNQLYFVSGLIAGETLYKDISKKDRPLPKLGAATQLTDIPEFYESSTRLETGTSVFRVTGSEPMQFAGRPGVKFTFEFAVSGSTLTRKGVAAGTIANDKLYLIVFSAPGIHYFDRDRAKAEAIMASAKI
jgi:hypothetical protein